MYLLIAFYIPKSIDRHIMKMAAVTNTLKRISELFREQTRQLNLIALVKNQLHYYMLFYRKPFISELEKQILQYNSEISKMGCKDVLQSQKYSSSSDLKEQKQILLVMFFLYKLLHYFMKLTRNQLTVFQKLHLTTSTLRYSQRTIKYRKSLNELTCTRKL